jgi:hypothetical protein
MADDVTLPGTGAVVATDEIGGNHHQLVKIEFGEDDVATKVSASNPLPVTMSSAPTGAATETTLATMLTQSDFDTKVGSLTETAPASDTASSGLNGRLQRIAQRISSLIALLPTSLGANGGLKIEGVASGTVVPISGTVAASNFPSTVDTNSGSKSSNTLRVVLATDQPALTNKLLTTPDLPSGASTAANQTAVQGTAGSAVPSKGNLVQGSDGTNARNLAVTTAGVLKIDLSAANAASPQTGTFTDKTKTSLSGSSETLIASNSSRKKIIIQNTGNANVGINLAGGAASIGAAGTLTLVPYGSYESGPDFVTTAAITVIGTAGQPCFAVEA